MMSMYERKRRAAKRGLKYIPLNDLFEGCSAHHINIKHVIHIPIDEHIIPHNAKTGYGMKAINEKAFKYLWNHAESLKINPIEALNIYRKCL